MEAHFAVVLQDRGADNLEGIPTLSLMHFVLQEVVENVDHMQNFLLNDFVPVVNILDGQIRTLDGLVDKINKAELIEEVTRSVMYQLRGESTSKAPASASAGSLFQGIFGHSTAGRQNSGRQDPRVQEVSHEEFFVVVRKVDRILLHVKGDGPAPDPFLDMAL